MYDVGFRDRFYQHFDSVDQTVQIETYNHILDLQNNPRPFASYEEVQGQDTFRFVYIFRFKLTYFIDEPQQRLEMLLLRPLQP